MSRGLGYLEQALLTLMDRSEQGLTAPWAAQELWGDDVTDAKKEAVHRALITLVNRGLVQRGGRRYYTQ
jgi:DNA-binding IclR family transcriptional regulator